VSGWKTFRVGDLVEPVKSWNPLRSESDDTFQYIDLSAVDQSLKRIVGAREVPCAEAPSRAKQLIKANDVLVSTVRPNLNGVAQVGQELDGSTASTGFCVLRPRASLLSSSYLFHWVKTEQFIADMVQKATGASYPAVSDKTILESTIAAPPIAEQRRIATILDQADALRAKRRETLAQLDSLTQSIFIEMFGDPVENPKEFSVKRLIDIIDSTRPITYGILMPGEDVDVGVKYVRVVDMKKGGIELSGIRKTTPEISSAFKRSVLKSGDLLMSIRGHVGRLAMVPPELNEANITQDTVRLAVSGASAVYVREYLRSLGIQRWMAKHTKGMAVRGINLGDLKSMPITLPPRPQQDDFAERAHALENLTALQRKSLTEFDTLFASLQHRAFAGEL
jgi:type I restriction enzyme S subunit